MNNKKACFCTSVNDANFKILKGVCSKVKLDKFGVYLEEFSAGISDDDLKKKITQAFMKLGYSNNPIIICLPRSQATCRLSKVPSLDPLEIEKIINFQAPKYLPYQAGELINGFEVTLKNKDGSSVINQVIVHKNVVERYLNIFKPLNPSAFKIVLSSYGLAAFLTSCEKKPVSKIVIDFDLDDVEIVIIKDGKLLFGRVFKIIKDNDTWQELFLKELLRSIETYAKETDNVLPSECVILTASNEYRDVATLIKNKFDWQIGFISYAQEIEVVIHDEGRILDPKYSFAGLLGLCKQNVADSLNLLPGGLKKQISNANILKRKFRILGLGAITFLILGFGIAKDLDNKSQYLSRLKNEVNAVAKEAKNLGDIEKRLNLLNGRSKSAPDALDLLTETNKIIPGSVYLSSFSFEKGQAIFRGLAQGLNDVFEFVSGMEKSKVFSRYQVKVRYATKRQSQNAEMVDFEIVCLEAQGK